MEKYKIEFKKSAAKELYSTPKRDLQKILSKIKKLSGNPRPDGCIKLTGREHYRIHHGNYRILYAIEDDRLVVYIVKVGHRRDIYK